MYSVRGLMVALISQLKHPQHPTTTEFFTVKFVSVYLSMETLLTKKLQGLVK
jgi:hypothetical protein